VEQNGVPASFYYDVVFYSLIIKIIIFMYIKIKKKKYYILRIFHALEEHTYIMIIFTIENHPTAHSLIVPFVIIQKTIIQTL